MKKHMKTTCSLIFSVLLIGCGEETSDRSDVAEESNQVIPHEKSPAEKQLDDFLKAYPNAKISDAVYYLNGEVAYYIISISEEGKPSTKIAIDDTGIVSPTQAKERYNKRYKEMYGIIHSSSYGLIEHLDDSEEVLITAWLIKGQESVDFIKTYCDLSCDIVSVSDDLEVMSFYTRKDNVLSLSTSSEIQEHAFLLAASLLERDSKNIGEQTSNNSDTSAGGYAATLYQNNVAGHHGGGGKVGIVEYVGKNCAIYEQHESLSGNTVHYATEINRSCDPNASYAEILDQCNDDLPCVATGGLSAVCVDDGSGNGVCVAPHASQVASRMASTYGSNPSHGAELDIYVANMQGGIIPPVLRTKYNWLLGEGVKVVNESFSTYNNSAGYGPGGPTIFADAAALQADEYARDHGLLIVKPAGNRWRNTTEGGYYPENTVFCTASNGICVGSVTSNDTYFNWAPIPVSLPIGFDAYLDDELADSSRWINIPNRNQCNSNGTCLSSDIERPDVASEGENAMVMDFESPNSWTRSSGSSFSAPVIAGLIAMESAFFSQSECWLDFAALGDNYYLLAWRAFIRNRALVKQSINEADFYPIPGQSPDSKVGAGLPLGATYGNNCEGVPTEDGNGGSKGETSEGITTYGSGDPEEDLSTGWDNPPSYWDSHVSFETTDISIKSEIYQLPLISYSKFAGDVQQKVIKRIQIAELPEGRNHELRMTVAFNSCPSTTSSFQPEINPYVDFDVLLCVDDLGVCYAESASIRDTVEGFHITVPKEYEGYEHTFYLIRGADATDPCPGYQYEPWRFGARHIRTP